MHSLVQPVEGERHLSVSTQKGEDSGRVITVPAAVANSNAHVDLYVR